MYVRGYKGCGTCAWRATNNSPTPLLKVLSGSRGKPLPWKRCLIYSNSWEVLCVVPVSNERGRTNSWRGIFFPTALLATTLNKRSRVIMAGAICSGSLIKRAPNYDHARLSCIQCLHHVRSKQISVLYFHLEDKIGTPELVLSFAVYL